MDSLIRSLLPKLRRARSFDDAARELLSAVMKRSTVAAQSYAEAPARIVRASVQLRDEEGVRAFAALDASGAIDEVASTGSSSATAWRWASTRLQPVALDVNLCTVELLGSGESESADPIEAKFNSNESQARLMERNVSHVLALPVLSPSHGALGLVTIEAECRRAIGRRFVWHGCVDDLEGLVALAAPCLLDLPQRADTAQPDLLLPVVGASMVPIIETLGVFAAQEETLLLSGPTGSGKSRLARWCHERSKRAHRPFEALDLATVPEDLQLAQLFGWKKGAFTSAHKDTPGAVARADGGTLFIDEIDKLSLRGQAGLLRVLEEKTYRMLGDTALERSADVRFVIGTSENLRRSVEEGGFRADLFYRINVLPVRVPPLRERKDEIAHWARYMLERRATSSGDTRGVTLTPDAEPLLSAHEWPGNLRQLDNIVRRAYVLALNDLREGGEPLALNAGHIERSLALEGGGVGSRGLFDQMRAAAMAFVLEAERLASEGKVLPLELAAALEAFVLEAAAQRSGSIEGALTLLGRRSTVDNRNYHKLVRGELARLKELADLVGARAPIELTLPGKDK